MASRTYLKNLAPAFSNGTAQAIEADIRGLDNLAEVHAVGVEIKVLGKSSSTAFNLAEGDPEIIMSTSTAGFGLSKVRLTYNREQDCVNVTPQYLRDVAAYMTGADPYSLATRSGPTYTDQVPATGGSAINFTFNVLIPFYNINRDFRNALCPSGKQLNQDGHIALDMSGSTLGSVVLANGTLVLSAVTSARVFAITGPRRRARAWVGPTLVIKQRALSQNPDIENGPFFDELVMETRDQATLTSAAANVNVEVDGSQIARTGTLFSDLTQGFVQTTAPADPRNGYDLTRNIKTTGVGRTPLTWAAGAIEADESEVPVVAGYRQIQYGTASAGTLVYVRWYPMDSANTLDAISTLAPGTEAQGLKFADLAVRGGSGGPLARYKARWLAPIGAPKAA